MKNKGRKAERQVGREGSWKRETETEKCKGRERGRKEKKRKGGRKRGREGAKERNLLCQ